jgi:small redox-active disulfide protein 2
VSAPGSPDQPASADITQISLGTCRVGISGLKGAIAEAKALQGRPDPEIAQALFDKLKSQNYIPTTAREEYQRAFLREFKKALGETVDEEQTAPVIKILGPGCPNCHRLEQLVLEVLTELRLAVEVEHVREVAQIAAHGVPGTPALIINDEVKVMGKVPSREALKQWLAELQT